MNNGRQILNVPVSLPWMIVYHALHLMRHPLIAILDRLIFSILLILKMKHSVNIGWVIVTSPLWIHYIVQGAVYILYRYKEHKITQTFLRYTEKQGIEVEEAPPSEGISNEELKRYFKAGIKEAEKDIKEDGGDVQRAEMSAKMANILVDKHIDELKDLLDEKGLSDLMKESYREVNEIEREEEDGDSPEEEE